jgi:hypothetical protein
MPESSDHYQKLDQNVTETDLMNSRDQAVTMIAIGR